MGQTLQQQGYAATRRDLQDAAAAQARARREAQLDATQMALGATGVVDPSPASDLANAAISAARGDYFGAFLDAVSAVPYLGDAVAKPMRATKLGARIIEINKKIAMLAERGHALTESLIATRKRAADAVKAQRKLTCQKCNNAYGTTTPTRGAWQNPNTPGHGTYTVDGNNYTFKEGYPDFDAPGMTGYLYNRGLNKTAIEMTGDRRRDEQLANAAAGYKRTPDNHTWHHGDDGSTMYLVATEHHKAVTPHLGGHRIAEDALF